MNAIEIEGLVRRFGQIAAVDNLNLKVPEGSVFALLGPNGAGKTTTIKVLMNFIQPTSGSATIVGVDSRRIGPTERRQIGYVSENQTLPLWMTVRQLLNYCRTFYPSWDTGLETALLADFDLPVQRKLKHLSRGMLIKANLLAALCYRPRLLILDEPFSGLDPVARDEFVQGILEATSLGEWTVFISSHDIEEVERLADHIGVIDRGHSRLNESSEHLLARHRRMELQVLDENLFPGHLPPEWLGAERAGDRVSFVTNQYEFGVTESLCLHHFPGATVRAAPLSLREIFLHFSRAGRTRNKAFP